MTQSSDNLKDLYKEIFRINDYFYEGEQGLLLVDDKDGSLHEYCHYGRISGNGKCNSYFEMASSGVIHLLKSLEKYGLENDKLAEYAILWLSYKLDQKQKDKLTDLNKFYTDHIETNEYYNNKINGNDSLSYKEIINRNNDLMNINEISKFNDPFGILLLLYYAIDLKNWNCTKYSNDANEFVKKFEELNKDSNNKENSSFSQILSTLSNDYENIKKIYNDKKSCKISPLPQIEPIKNFVEISGKDSGQTLGQTPEGTLSSSSILNTVIPSLSTFAIPVFLGVAYKYSLFGIDKLFQRQYIRNKLKKIKKKMELNI
ncbi:CIR protein PIR protein [Plasmodium vinckei vinckei]|uniref:CIR protein PIR protein n=1 Tax=Plasmodium vinckei vinckei TaxID=54757 RepID=A0A449BM88_PLAVN|nr:CIR protein PIR protein [Plasmodium vinckei vinckei]VEV54547.1 CIR protein PIR protein [Plasmodium vinckei vinckei]